MLAEVHSKAASCRKRTLFRSRTASLIAQYNLNRLVVQIWIEILITALNKQYNEFDSVTLCFLDIHLEKVLIFCDILSFINSFLQVFLSLYRSPTISNTIILPNLRELICCHPSRSPFLLNHYLLQVSQ